MDKEMADIVDVLYFMYGNPGLKGDLFDFKGFPRADVDIFEC